MVDSITKMMNDAVNGDRDPLHVMAELKRIEEAVKMAKEIVLPDAIGEFEKHGEKEVEKFGFKISKSSGGRYDYSGSVDWKEAMQRVKVIEQKMQAAYKGGGPIVDEDTGEYYEPAIYKESKESLTFKI